MKQVQNCSFQLWNIIEMIEIILRGTQQQLELKLFMLHIETIRAIIAVFNYHVSVLFRTLKGGCKNN